MSNTVSNISNKDVFPEKWIFWRGKVLNVVSLGPPGGGGGKSSDYYSPELKAKIEK